MTTQELIELSLLDAYGLLEEAEREAFERAFRAASPALQAHVRREQTRLSRMDNILPDVEPPAGLRAAVLEAVRRAMAAARPGLRIRARMGWMPPLLPSRNVSPVWRAAALAMATAAVLFAAATLYIRGEYAQYRRTIQSDTLLAELSKKFGAPYVHDVIFDADTKRAVFTRPDDQPGAQASLFVNPEWDRAKFFCEGLEAKEGRTLRIAIVNERDEVVRVLHTFAPNGTLTPEEFELGPGADRAGLNLAILRSEAGGDGSTVISRARLAS